MKCKLNFNDFPEFFVWIVLIESKWNVNNVSSPILPESFKVLIESKWNVNYEDIVYFAASLRVLIESKWNVNLPARSRYSIPAMF